MKRSIWLITVALWLCLWVLPPRTAATPAAATAGLPFFFAQEQRLTDPDVTSGEWFGFAVDVQGDTAVIGANRNAHDNLIWAGAAYVWQRVGGVWSQTQMLVASDAADYDFFGFSVAIDGDTIVVGAYSDDYAGLLHVGSAYVFVKQGELWVEQGKLTPADPGQSDYFGAAVDVQGDTAVVGSWFDDHSGLTDAGSAYVFNRRDGVWSQTVKLIAADAGTNEQMGYSLVLEGDTIAVGAYQDNLPGLLASAGSVYVFTQIGPTSWPQTQKLTAFPARNKAEFGFSVDIDGDTMAVGAYVESETNDVGAGAVYLYERAPGGGAWVPAVRLAPFDGQVGSFFGVAVSLSGDSLAVGAYGHNYHGVTDTGAVYLYQRYGDAGWGFKQQVVSADLAESDLFGYDVILADDTLWASALWDDERGISEAGAVYTFGLRAPAYRLFLPVVNHG